MATIELPEGPGTERERLWSLRPVFGAAADHFNDVVQNNSILSLREQEAARARIAHINGCEPCSNARVADMAAHGLDESFYSDVDDPARRERFSVRERLAIEFAERFAAGKEAFDGQFWTDLQGAFQTDEIFDLAMSVAKWLALGRVNAVFDLAVACPIILSPRAAA